MDVSSPNPKLGSASSHPSQTKSQFFSPFSSRTQINEQVGTHAVTAFVVVVDPDVALVASVVDVPSVVSGSSSQSTPTHTISHVLI